MMNPSTMLEGVTAGSEMITKGVRQHPRGRTWARVKIILPPLTPLSLPYRDHHHQALAILCHFLPTYLNFGRKLHKCQERRSFRTLYGLYVSEGDIETIILILWVALAIISPAYFLQQRLHPDVRQPTRGC
jgi:hypothetical protein